jgi:chromosome segregation ATPase
LKVHKQKIEKKTAKLIKKVCKYGKQVGGNCEKKVTKHTKKVVATAKKVQIKINIVKKVDLPKKVLVQKVEKAKNKLVELSTKKVVVDHVAPKKEETVKKVVVEYIAPKKEVEKITHKKVIGKTTVEDCDEEKEVLVKKLHQEEKENKKLKLQLKNKEEKTISLSINKIEMEKKNLQKELLLQQEKKKELENKLTKEEEEKNILESDLKKEIHVHAKKCACAYSSDKQKCVEACKSRKVVLKEKVTTHHDVTSNSCVAKASIACGPQDTDCQKDFIVLCVEEEIKKKNELLNILDNCDSYLDDSYSVVYQP